MAKLIMKDGTVRNCDYNKAAKIQQVLIGIKKPDDKAQAAFVATVAEVDFNDGVKVTHASAPEAPKEADPEFARIMADKKLNGIERARAVANHIKARK